MLMLSWLMVLAIAGLALGWQPARAYALSGSISSAHSNSHVMAMPCHEAAPPTLSGNTDLGAAHSLQSQLPADDASSGAQPSGAHSCCTTACALCAAMPLNPVRALSLAGNAAAFPSVAAGVPTRAVAPETPPPIA